MAYSKIWRRSSVGSRSSGEALCSDNDASGLLQEDTAGVGRLTREWSVILAMRYCCQDRRAWKDLEDARYQLAKLGDRRCGQL
jgi:hypothetical protein